MLQALSLLGMAVVNELWPALFLMVLAGAAWITTGNVLSVASQQGLPDWLRARGRSISLATVMGTSALGAAIWGQVASLTSVHTVLLLAAPLLLLGMTSIQKLWPDRGEDEDLTPMRQGRMPEALEPPGHGQVMMETEYIIDPEQSESFMELMLGEVRSSRLRFGSLSWELKQDLGQPGRFIEAIVDASWVDHLRHFNRLTASDLKLRKRRLSFHLGAEEPEVRRYLLASTTKHR